MQRFRWMYLQEKDILSLPDGFTLSATDICTKYHDDGFCVDLGYFGHFRGTNFVGGGSQLDRLLLELEDWITARYVSAGAGAEARGDWIRGNGWKWLSFSLILWTFTWI